MAATRLNVAKGVFSVVLLQAGCAATVPPHAGSSDNLPMYGQPRVERSAVDRKADEEFVSAVVQKLGSREKGAQIWVAEGERYLRDGELRLAMRRCNEGWLLNPSFYKVYWCLGRIQNERGLPGEAVGLAERAIELVDDDYQRPALLADLGAMYVGKAGAVERSDTRDSQRLLRKATDLFAESTKIDDSYSPAYRGWAIALYRLGEYEAARSKYESAVARGEKYWPSGFEASLAAKRGK